MTAVVMALGLAAGACGDGAGGVASCTVSQTISFGAEAPETLMLCQEADGLSGQQLSQFRQSCMFPSQGAPDAGLQVQARFSSGPCPRAQALGGCRIMNAGVAVTAWYYQNGGTTPDDIRGLCAGIGAAFVPA